MASKFFRVAVEGGTTDGRKIERSWIQDMADTYIPTKYAARVNMEHYRSVMPDGQFGSYGDVLALKAQEVDLGDGTKRLALFAQIEPLPRLVELTKAKQKLYTSIEITPNFSNSGKAYLTGLAVTDSPASLGTEMLAFAAQHPTANPYAGRKQHPDNLFSESGTHHFTATDLEPEAPPAAGGGGGSGDGLLNSFIAGMSKLFTSAQSSTTPPATQTGMVSEAAVVEMGKTMTAALERAQQQFAAQGQQLTALQQELTAIKGQLAAIDKTDPGKFTQRPPALGGDTTPTQTDC